MATRDVEIDKIVRGVAIPSNLEMAIQALDEMIPRSDVEAFMAAMKDLDPDKQEQSFILLTDYPLGVWMQKFWGLRRGSQLRDSLVAMGIEHPGDMSSVIITSFIRKKFGRPQDIEGQVGFFKTCRGYVPEKNWGSGINSDNQSQG